MTAFISTAIPYVNARPHLGFAYELVLADILARHHRQRGREVRFITGTDEHSLKNVTAAACAGVGVRELVDRNAAAFAALGPLLDVRVDDFVRTTDPRHRAIVEELWRACRDDLYRASWSGRYCAGCEAFVDDDVRICDEHRTEPELVIEENWFFRLSRYREAIREALETRRVRIVPEGARSETLAFLAGDVRDLSVSRVATRSAGWGIPVPDDSSQVIYVWFDALASYLTAGYRDAGDRTHVIGKGITRFHAVYWLAFLLAAKLPLPERIFVHGYLTVDGKKIGKSLGGGDVEPVIAACGVDALRWFYARHCRTRTDADVSIETILACHDRDLADRLGNLVHRIVTLAAKRAPAPPASTPEATTLRAIADALPARIDAALAVFAIDEAADAIIDVLDAANRYLDIVAPWRHADTSALHAPLDAVRIAIAELSPFVPSLAAQLTLQPGAPPIPRRR